MSDNNLFERVLDMANSKNVSVKEGTSFTKFGRGPKKLYVAMTKTLNRIDLSGFTLDSPDVTQVSEEEARKNKMGNVRGQLLVGGRDFESFSDLLSEAFDVVATSELEYESVQEEKAKKIQEREMKRAAKTTAKEEE